MPKPKPRRRLDFKEYNFKDLFCIRDCIKMLIQLGINDKYLIEVQKAVGKEIERGKFQ